MKKWIAALLLAAVCSVCACAGGDGTAQTDVLASFESYDEITVYSFSESFGRASLCNEEEYLTEGDYSLKIEPVGKYNSTDYPTFTLHTDTEIFGNSDFSEYSQVSFDMYNSAAEARTIDVKITGRSLGTSYALPVLSVTLNPQSWNVVTYDFSDGAIIRYNPGITDITQIDISFHEKRTSSAEYVPDVYYLDNLRGTKGEIRNYAPDRGEDEILDFENLGDLKTIGLTGNIQLSQETSSLKVSQGRMSLRAEGEGTMYIYLGSLLEGRTFSSNSIAFDVLNDDSFSHSYSVQVVFPATGSELTNPTVTGTISVRPYEWATFEFGGDWLPEGRSLTDAAYLSITTSASVSYFDAFRLV